MEEKPKMRFVSTRRKFLYSNSAAFLAAQARLSQRASAAQAQGHEASKKGQDAWWKGPLCISDVQLTPDEVRRMGADAAAAKIADLGFNVQELAFPALPGYEGSYLRA